MHGAALSLLHEAGIEGLRAESDLRHILAALAGPSADTISRLAAHGLSPEELDPSIQPLAGIFAKLATAGLTEADTTALFGQRGGRAARALMARAERLRQLSAAQSAAGTGS